MAPDNTRLRFKTDVTADTKVKVDLKGKTYRAGQDATMSKEDAKKLVDGGFADYLDERGYVIFEEKTRASDTPHGEDKEKLSKDDLAKPAEAAGAAKPTPEKASAKKSK